MRKDPESEKEQVRTVRPRWGLSQEQAGGESVFESLGFRVYSLGFRCHSRLDPFLCLTRPRVLSD